MRHAVVFTLKSGICVEIDEGVPPLSITLGNVVEFQKWGGSSGGDYRPRLTVKLSLMVAIL